MIALNIQETNFEVNKNTREDKNFSLLKESP